MKLHKANIVVKSWHYHCLRTAFKTIKYSIISPISNRHDRLSTSIRKCMK